VVEVKTEEISVRKYKVQIVTRI